MAAERAAKAHYLALERSRLEGFQFHDLRHSLTAHPELQPLPASLTSPIPRDLALAWS
jgi:hypothetical protein